MTSTINSCSSCSQSISYSASSISSSSSSDSISSEPEFQKVLNKSLIMYAESGDAKPVELLLKLKADPNTRDSYLNTPLHIAAVCGHSVVMKLLLDVGAAKYAGGGFPVKIDPHRTPMYFAILFEHLDAVKILVEARYDVNYQPACNRSSPLDQARQRTSEKSEKIAQYLLSKGAKPSLSPDTISRLPT